jgi:L-fuconolactonase
VSEEIIDPDRRIIDPHHHLWPTPARWGPYDLGELWADTGSGHRVEQTVFVECRANYRTDGAPHLASVGEVEFVADRARLSRASAGRASISGIVAFADLTSGPLLEETLDALQTAGGGLVRGIRHAGPFDTSGSLSNPGGRWPCPYGDPDFRAGLEILGERGWTYDTWHFHHQIPAFTDLARAVPGTTLILDHFGTPLGVGVYAGHREEIFQRWKQDIADLASCPNVVAKLGGMAMPDNGFGWDWAERPPTSDEFVAAQERYFLHTIDCFGPHRCMFESNFPVDRRSISYPVLWNAFKKIGARFDEQEQQQLFSGTAERVYRLGSP